MFVPFQDYNSVALAILALFPFIDTDVLPVWLSVMYCEVFMFFNIHSQIYILVHVYISLYLFT